MPVTSLFLTIISVITLGIGVYFNQQGTNIFLPHEVVAPDVLSETIENSPSPTATSTPKATVKPSIAPSPTTASQIQLNVQTNNNTSNNSNINWNYPNGMITNDSPDTVLAWYKQKFQELNFKAKATSYTNTNGNILAKLAGANSSTSVTIKVTKSASETVTKIELE